MFKYTKSKSKIYTQKMLNITLLLNIKTKLKYLCYYNYCSKKKFLKKYSNLVQVTRLPIYYIISDDQSITTFLFTLNI